MSRPALLLSVSSDDKLALEQLLASGIAQVRVVLRALALRTCLKTKWSVAAVNEQKRYGSWFPLKYGAVRSPWRVDGTS